MRKAYDTILQSVVIADLAAKNGDFEQYRYECACCGEEVYIAAAHSTSMVPHFRHRNGNNDVECEKYLGKYGENTDTHSRKSNHERVEFYFDGNKKTFNLGLRFSKEEINTYEQNNAKLEIRSSASEQAFSTLEINNGNFFPDDPTQIPIDEFSFCYFLSNTFNKMKRKYNFFKPGKTPIFFKIQGYDSNYKAKLIHNTTLYTNVPYFVAFQNHYSVQPEICFSDNVYVEDKFPFETMDRKFLGMILTIKKKTEKIDALLLSWGYQLEVSETLTLLWPPATLVDEVTLINSDHAFLYSSFELLAHGNISVNSKDLCRVGNGISKVLVKSKVKVFKKNAEITINKNEQLPYNFDKISLTESTANTYIVPSDDNIYFLFDCSGVKLLNKGQSVLLTPQDEIRCYQNGYLIGRVYLLQKEKLSGEYLLNDILSHYKCVEPFDESVFNSSILSITASQYIEKCKVSNLINIAVKRFIKEGLL
ncbi:MAG: hypothetical protein PWQ77_820 [Kosmotogales bacterium]|nr:hypothetical protein [Kosmotogales bacterium]